jgi:hypothetical protein
MGEVRIVVALTPGGPPEVLEPIGSSSMMGSSAWEENSMWSSMMGSADPFFGSGSLSSSSSAPDDADYRTALHSLEVLFGRLCQSVCGSVERLHVRVVGAHGLVLVVHAENVRMENAEEPEVPADTSDSDDDAEGATGSFINKRFSLDVLRLSIVDESKADAPVLASVTYRPVDEADTSNDRVDVSFYFEPAVEEPVPDEDEDDGGDCDDDDEEAALAAEQALLMSEFQVLDDGEDDDNLAARASERSPISVQLHCAAPWRVFLDDGQVDRLRREWETVASAAPAPTPSPVPLTDLRSSTAGLADLSQSFLLRYSVHAPPVGARQAGGATSTGGESETSTAIVGSVHMRQVQVTLASIGTLTVDEVTARMSQADGSAAGGCNGIWLREGRGGEDGAIVVSCSGPPQADLCPLWLQVAGSTAVVLLPPLHLDVQRGIALATRAAAVAAAAVAGGPAVETGTAAQRTSRSSSPPRSKEFHVTLPAPLDVHCVIDAEGDEVLLRVADVSVDVGAGDLSFSHCTLVHRAEPVVRLGYDAGDEDDEAYAESSTSRCHVSLRLGKAQDAAARAGHRLPVPDPTFLLTHRLHSRDLSWTRCHRDGLDAGATTVHLELQRVRLHTQRLQALLAIVQQQEQTPTSQEPETEEAGGASEGSFVPSLLATVSIASLSIAEIGALGVQGVALTGGAAACAATGAGFAVLTADVMSLSHASSGVFLETRQTPSFAAPGEPLLEVRGVEVARGPVLFSLTRAFLRVLPLASIFSAPATDGGDDDDDKDDGDLHAHPPAARQPPPPTPSPLSSPRPPPPATRIAVGRISLTSGCVIISARKIRAEWGVPGSRGGGLLTVREGARLRWRDDDGALHTAVETPVLRVQWPADGRRLRIATTAGDTDRLVVLVEPATVSKVSAALDPLAVLLGPSEPDGLSAVGQPRARSRVLTGTGGSAGRDDGEAGDDGFVRVAAHVPTAPLFRRWTVPGTEAEPSLVIEVPELPITVRVQHETDGIELHALLAELTVSTWPWPVAVVRSPSDADWPWPQLHARGRIEDTVIEDHVAAAHWRHVAEVPLVAGEVLLANRFLPTPTATLLSVELQQLAQVRLFIDQSTLDFLVRFAAAMPRSSATSADESPDPVPLSPQPPLDASVDSLPAEGGLTIDHLSLCDIFLLIDYRPASTTDLSHLAPPSIAGMAYILQGVPVDQAPVHLAAVPSLDALPDPTNPSTLARLVAHHTPSLAATWPQLLGAVGPVRVALSLTSATLGLLALPVSDQSTSSAVRSFTAELLSASAKLTAGAHRLTTGAADVATHADQPTTVGAGAAAGLRELHRGLGDGLYAATLQPVDTYATHGPVAAAGAALLGVPRLLLSTVSGVTGALMRVTQGAANAVDPTRVAAATAKHKGEREREAEREGGSEGGGVAESMMWDANQAWSAPEAGEWGVQ